MNPVLAQLSQLSTPVLRKPRRMTTLALLCALATSPGFALTEAESPAVGEVSMLIGEAYIVQADGKTSKIAVGSSIRVSDKIETGSGGFVHIRFVDNELVAVRPYSTLEIESFDYDPQSPQNSTIRFHQEEGVARYISGETAENAKQNFRLNTPIAAIGVRGTDFVVSANQKSIRAMVNEGAIVVAPYSSMCSIDALGPCNQDAVELSSLSRQILEMNTNTTAGATTSLVPVNPVPAEQLLALAVVDTPKTTPQNQSQNKKEKEAGLYADTVTSLAVNTTLATPLPSRPTPVPPEFTPDLPESVDSLTSAKQLVWGRWGDSNLAMERITVPYASAKESGRKVGPGNSQYVMFRVENGPKVVQRGLGELKFNLTQAQAHYKVAGNAAQLMDVLGGSLQMDFQTNRFSTDLELSHAATGKVQFSANGRIQDGGYFSAIGEAQEMAGAVSLDGKEAGYYFEKIQGAGTIDGLTLWGSTPK